MHKLIYTSDQPDEFFASLAQSGHLVTNLIETETGVKSAASALIGRGMLEEHMPKDKDTAMLHIIAMGASNKYGFNRNGDWFHSEVLDEYHPTFVSDAKVYREHANKAHNRDYGDVVYSAFDPQGMNRVELLLHIPKDRGGYLYERAKAGEDIDWSMACKVPFDICSCCGNVAPTVFEYCDCLRNHMTRWMPEKKEFAYAINTRPKFIDISQVENPADKGARLLEVIFPGDLEKAASTYGGQIIVPSAYRGQEYLGNDPGTIDPAIIGCLDKLALAEDYIKTASMNELRANSMVNFGAYSGMGHLDQEDLDALWSVDTDSMMAMLSKSACMLSLPAFAAYINQDIREQTSDTTKLAMALFLPGIHSKIKRDGVNQELLAGVKAASNEKVNRQHYISKITKGIQEKLASSFSLSENYLNQRVRRSYAIVPLDGSTIKDAFTKVATSGADREKAARLAEAYGHYQLASLAEAESRCGGFSVTPQIIDTVIGANSVRLDYNLTAI